MFGNGTDPHTGGAVPVLCPDGGYFSARLGNDSIGAQAEKLIFQIPAIDSTNALFVYNYAVILQDPGHPPGDQPRFEISILDAAGDLIDSVCGYYMVWASAGNIGFETYWEPGETVPIEYRNWTMVGMNLEPYMGQSIKIEFATGDCAQTGHFGYAYIDAYCAPMKISVITCENSNSVTFTAPPGFWYQWSTGDTTQTIVITDPQEETYTCTLITISNPQCQLTLYAVVENINLLDGAELNVCEDSTLTLDGGEYAGAVYSWTGPNNFYSNIHNPVIDSITFADAGEYEFTMALDSDCISTSNLQIFVTPKPIVDLGPDTTLCSDSTLYFDLSFNQECTFLWHASVEGYSYNSELAHILIDKPGTYSVTVTNDICPPIIDTIVVQYNDFSLYLGENISGVCISNPVTLNATIPLEGYPAVYYNWSNNYVTPTFTPLTSGTYSVTVTRGFCVQTDMINVEYDMPVAINLPSHLDLCEGTAVIIDPGQFLGANYLWSTGVNTQAIQITLPGTYIVTITNSCGSSKDSTTVTFLYLPVVDLGNDTTICTGQNIYLSALNDGATYLWSTNQISPAIAVSTGGIYSVTVTNQCGSTTDQIHVTGDVPLNLDFGPDSTVCPGYVLDCGVPNAGYLWSTGQTTQSININQEGYYSAEVTNACGTYTSGVSYSLLNTVVNLGNDTTICQGNTLLLDAGPGNYYYWSTGQFIPAIEVNQAGIYDVAVTNICGTYFDTIVVSVFDEYLFLGNDTIICDGTTITLDAEHPGSEYEWSTGEYTQAIMTGAPGTYFVHLSHPCGDLADTIVVSVYPPVTIDLGNDTLITGQPVTLDAGTGYVSYHWSTGASTQTITVQSTAYYSVTVTDSNGCHGTGSVFLQFTSIQEQSPGSFRILQTAAKEIVIISNNNQVIDNINIFDCLGNLIISGHPAKTRVILDLSRAADGLYFLRIESKGKTIVRKINLVR
jgi:hypothetical protein